MIHPKENDMPVTGVITAAGRSSRMAPDHKLIMELHGKTLIRRSLESLLPFCDKIIIVVGANASAIEKETKHDKVIRVKNEDDLNDMFSSVKTGLRQSTGRVLFLPGDCPFSPPDLIQRMLAANGDLIVAAYKGKTGHPILLSETAVQAILNDSTLHHLKQYLQTHPLTLVNATSESVLWDIDTHSDLHKAQVYFAKLEGE